MAEIKDSNTINIRTAIKNLKKEKKKWLTENYSATDLKKKLYFKDSEIRKIKATIEYGKKRYLRSDVLRYLKGDKKRIELFIALDTQQASFLPPVGKNMQGKLAIKK